jgi:hypothetical protein
MEGDSFVKGKVTGDESWVICCLPEMKGVSKDLTPFQLNKTKRFRTQICGKSYADTTLA